MSEVQRYQERQAETRQAIVVLAEWTNRTLARNGSNLVIARAARCVLDALERRELLGGAWQQLARAAVADLQQFVTDPNCADGSHI